MQLECDRFLIGHSHDEVERYGREIIPLRRNARPDRVHAHVHKVLPPVARRGDKEDEHRVREVVEGAKRGIEPISGRVRVVSGAELLLEQALRMQRDGSGWCNESTSPIENPSEFISAHQKSFSAPAHAKGWMDRCTSPIDP